jgi:hypothetical protein
MVRREAGFDFYSIARMFAGLANFVPGADDDDDYDDDINLRPGGASNTSCP